MTPTAATRPRSLTHSRCARGGEPSPSPLDISLAVVARHPEHHGCPPAAVWFEAGEAVVVCGCGIVLDHAGPVADPGDVQLVANAIDRVQAPHGTPHDLAPHGQHRKIGIGRAEHCGACRTGDPTTLARALAVVVAQARADGFLTGWQHAMERLDEDTPKRIGA